MYEFASASRVVRMNYKQEAPGDFWMGWSRGRWEGDTLVVDVTGQRKETWFDRSGNYHSEALRVVERYTLVSPYHIIYQATIEDPNVSRGHGRSASRCTGGWRRIFSCWNTSVSRSPKNSCTDGFGRSERRCVDDASISDVVGCVGRCDRSGVDPDGSRHGSGAKTGCAGARGYGRGKAATRAATPAKTPWGDPDLQGIWNFATSTPLERPAIAGEKAVLSDRKQRSSPRSSRST